MKIFFLSPKVNNELIKIKKPQKITWKKCIILQVNGLGIETTQKSAAEVDIYVF